MKFQPVYAIGPDFQENFSFPCITCWTTKLLGKSILKRLEKMFNDEIIVKQVVVTPADTNINESSNGDNSGHYEKNGNTNSNNNEERSKKELPIDEEDSKENNGFDDDDDNKDDDGDDDDGGDDDGGDDDYSNGRDNDFISVTSGVKAKIEGHNESQTFYLSTKLRAKVVDKRKDTILKFHVNVRECRTRNMLSKRYSEIGKEGCGYFLDSVEVCVSPVAHGPNGYVFSLKSSPQSEGRVIEHSTGREKTFGITGKFGLASLVELIFGYKGIRGTV